MFGNAPCDTRMAGDGPGYDLCVAIEQKHARVTCIDPRRSDIATNHDVEWIPIRPGTDAALVAGIAHELIASGLVDVEFLHKYCVGYDEETLPEGAPANSSYYAYIMGTGYDMVEKTPAWAAAITQIPEQRIIDLAHEIGEAKPCYICQGWGPQRRTNGETAARAIMLLPQLVGQVGKPGTNSGMREGNGGFGLPSLPTGDNPIEAKFPNYLWPEAIKFGTEMTATKDGIKNADALPAPVKFLVNYGNNMPANQNGDINYTTDVLKDESLCEFILCYDVVMTDSAKYADIILPDLTPQETWTLSTQGENNDTKGIWFGQPTTEPKFERREVYEVCADLAERLGVYDEYTNGGMTREDWCKQLYEEFREENPQAPTWEEGLAAGLYKEDMEVSTDNEPFIDDPEANPLETATGKIQVYSPELAELAATWQIAEGDVISPIPQYVPGFNGPDANTEEYPLQITGYHTKAHTHSSYANNQIIQDAHHHNVWINPLDADPRGIKNGDEVRVFNDQGEIRIEARVTNRVMPGVAAIPQGMWHDADMDGDRIDKGGCINTLTSRHCTPVAKAPVSTASSAKSRRRKGEYHGSVRVPFQRLALHGLQDVHAGLQGLLQPFERDRVPQGVRIRRRRVAAGCPGCLDLRQLHVLRVHFLQPLRQPDVLGQVPAGRHLEGRRDGHRLVRPREVHRVRHVRDRLPLRCAHGGRRAEEERQVHPVRRPRGRRQAAHLRGGLPRARA